MKQQTEAPLPLVEGQKEKPVGVRIFDNAVYTLESACKSLTLPKSCLRREIRLGRLRRSKRAGRYFIFGKWLREWLEGGEVKNDQVECTRCRNSNGQPTLHGSGLAADADRRP